MIGSPRSIPAPALILGWAGVIPFASLALAVIAGVPLPVPSVTALVAYAATILSFMGGAQWGLTAATKTGFAGGWTGYAISVLPALVAWPAVLMPSRLAIECLVAAFGLLLAYDLWSARHGIAPPWYGALRIQLTSAVVVFLGVAVLAI